MVMTAFPVQSVEYYWKSQKAYYLNGREPRGVLYTPKGPFGLRTGELVDVQVYARLMAGQDPRSGEQLTKAAKSGKRVPGYDLTFEAPKSVSIAWAFAPDDVRRKIESAQERAVQKALEVIQAEATFTRLGKDGEKVKRTELFGFLFQHGDARPVTLEGSDGSRRTYSDMHLHTHAVIPNIARTMDEDGTVRWSAIDGRCFLQWQKAGGAIYHAELAEILQRELGVQIRFREDTTFDIQGFSQQILDRFSKRGNQIEKIVSTVGATKGSSAKLAGAAQLLSREIKEPADDRIGRWREEALEHGFLMEDLAQVFNRAYLAPRADKTIGRWERENGAEAGLPVTLREAVDQVVLEKTKAGPSGPLDAPTAPAIVIDPPPLSEFDLMKAAQDWKGAKISYPSRITQTESVVRCQDLYISAAKLAVENGKSGSAAMALVADGLQQETIIPLGQDEKLSHQAVYSTFQMRQIEERLARLWEINERDKRHVLNEAAVEHHIQDRAEAGKPYTTEQAGGIRWVCLRGGAAAILEGGAGTGKSYTMGGVAELYRDAGYRVIGCATEWDAAKKLQAEAGITDCKALAQWLSDWERGIDLPDERTVIIPDEAAKIGSVDMHHLSEIAFAAGSKIIPTGDTRQQLGVSAGPALKIAVRGAGSFRLEDTQRMWVQADDVLVHLEGLSREDAIAKAKELSQAARDDLVRKHHFETEQRARAWGIDPAKIGVADALVHVRKLSREQANVAAQNMSDTEGRNFILTHHKEIARAGAIWARQAATDLSFGRSKEALEAFQKHGDLVWCDTIDLAIDQSVADWMAYKRENPDGTAAVGAKTNKHAIAQTAKMRLMLRGEGLIGQEDIEIRAMTRQGAASLKLAVGDQVRFTKKEDSLEVYNGVVGTVLTISPEDEGHARLEIQVSDEQRGERIIEFSTHDIADEYGLAQIEHYYATTTYSVQGATKVRYFGLLDGNERSNSAYVAGSRARQQTKFYIPRDRIDIRLREQLPLEERLDEREFTDDERQSYLEYVMAISQSKTCTLDYATADIPIPIPALDARELEVVSPASAVRKAQVDATRPRMSINPAMPPARISSAIARQAIEAVLKREAERSINDRRAELGRRHAGYQTEIDAYEARVQLEDDQARGGPVRIVTPRMCAELARRGWTSTQIEDLDPTGASEAISIRQAGPNVDPRVADAMNLVDEIRDLQTIKSEWIAKRHAGAVSVERRWLETVQRLERVAPTILADPNLRRQASTMSILPEVHQASGSRRPVEPSENLVAARAMLAADAEATGNPRTADRHRDVAMAAQEGAKPDPRRRVNGFELGQRVEIQPAEGYAYAGVVEGAFGQSRLRIRAADGRVRRVNLASVDPCLDLDAENNRDYRTEISEMLERRRASITRRTLRYDEVERIETKLAIDAREREMAAFAVEIDMSLAQAAIKPRPGRESRDHDIDPGRM